MIADERPRIRRATIDDLARLASLRREFTFEADRDPPSPRSGYSDAFADVVGPGIASGRWTVWVAETEGEIVAHVYVGLLEKIPRPIPGHRWIGYMTNVYTRPPYRGRGIGSALLDRVKTWARAESVELLVVWPSEDSVDFYERAGFARGRDPLVWEQAAVAER